MRSLNVAIVGGGPAGLFLARLLRLHDPGSRVVVYERDPEGAIYGFGVVFSSRTLSAVQEADTQTFGRIQDIGVSWREIEFCRAGDSLRYNGHGLAAVSRRRLLDVLLKQAIAVGADVRFSREIPTVDALEGADVVALAGGANCSIRDDFATEFGTHITSGGGKYIWFGTHAPFDKMSFAFETTEFGAFAGHAYPYEDGASSYIITADAESWRASGMDRHTEEAQEPGRSDAYSLKLMERVFRDHLSGALLIGNNSKWTSFRVVRNRRLSYRNMVLIGDAAHTAHPSVGSGTKMALEDAIVLARALMEANSPAEAYASYEAARRPGTLRTQRMAEPSMYWWETFRTRAHVELRQLGFHYLTRTRAITFEGMRRRDPANIAHLERWFAGHGEEAGRGRQPNDALATPIDLGRERLRNRMVMPVLGADEAARRSFVSRATAGFGLVVADWTTVEPPFDANATGSTSALEWKAAAESVRGHGGVPAVAIRAGDDAAAGFAQAMGVTLLEIESTRETAEWLRRLTFANADLWPVARLRCPDEPVWTEAGDRFVARCRRLAAAGARAFHLTAATPPGTSDQWHHLVDYSDRIRAELRVTTLVDATDSRAMATVPPEGQREAAAWIHTALLAGRTDLVAAPPLRRHAIT